MNPLFSKISTNKYVFLWITLSVCNLLFANDSIPKSSFQKHCKNSDAYLLYSYKDVSYAQSWSKYRRETSISNKLVVNTSAGVDKYAFLDLTQFISNNLLKLKVRTLKADGSVVELDSSLVFNNNSNVDKLNSKSYPIPGVEPGDTIETSYVYNEYQKLHELMDFVHLYSSVPSMKTEYTISSSPELLVRYKTYNSFPEPLVVTNDTLIHCVFKMEEVKGFEENENTCISCELPYLYYSVEKKKNEMVTWKDVYNFEFNVLTQPIAFDRENSSYYRRWKKKVIGKAKDSSKFYKFKLLHESILYNMEMGPTQLNELAKSSGYFLKKKQLDPFSIKRLYRRILEDLEIDYSAVFARSKRAGSIDPYYIRKGEYDHIFFAYTNEQGSISLLYPHEEHYKYQINEIPTSLYNTQAIIAKPYLPEKRKKSDKFINYDLKLAKVDSVSSNIVKLPGMSVDHNYIKQIYYGDVDIKEKTTTLKHRFSVSGGLSTDIRRFFSLLEQDEKISDFYDALTEFEGNDTAIQIDTILKSHFINVPPFNFTLTAKGSLNSAINFVNDSIVSISLDKIIQHNQIESEHDYPDLNFYLDYSYTDYCLLNLNFPCDIEILGLDRDATDFKNNYGNYFFELKKVGNNQISLKSNYKITKNMIPKDEYYQLLELNSLVKKIKNKHLIIKLKNLQ